MYIYIEDCINGIMTGYAKLDKKVNIFNLAVEDNKIVDRVADIVMREMGLEDVKRKYTGGPRGWIGEYSCGSPGYFETQELRVVAEILR